MYEKATFGDTVSLLMLSYYQEQFLYWVMCDGYTPGLGWGLFCESVADSFFKRYVRKECLIGDSALALAAMKSALCAQNSWSLWSAANTYFDVSCLGLKIYESSLYDTDTTMLPALMGTRYSRLARTEAYLYGSSRLGMDTEEQVIADSLDKVRCVYNPLIKLWHKVGVVDTSKQKFAVVNDSLVQYHTAGLKRYEFANHLGNVLAVTSDRKIAVDTLSGLQVDFYYADLYSVQDYDPFGMIQVGRSWKRKDYRFSFNGKEDESWQVQDFDARMYDKLACRWLSIDPVVHPYESPFVAFANNPIYYTDPTGTTEYPTSEEYKKANPQGKGDGSDGHWLTADRNASNEVWKKANEVNLGKANGYVNYETIGQRADFYKWFQSHTESKGFETKWAGAAHKVASDINNLETLANIFGVGDYVFMGHEEEVSAFANKGNRMIFEEVFPKLQLLASGNPLKGADAQKWDGQALAEEQSLIQPLYTEFISKYTALRLEDMAKGNNMLLLTFKPIASQTPLFLCDRSLLNISHRWQYGMRAMGYKPVSVLQMPLVSLEFKNRSKYILFFNPAPGYSDRDAMYKKEQK